MFMTFTVLIGPLNSKSNKNTELFDIENYIDKQLEMVQYVNTLKCILLSHSSW